MHKISNRIFEIFFKKTLDFLLAGFRFYLQKKYDKEGKKQKSDCTDDNQAYKRQYIKKISLNTCRYGKWDYNESICTTKKEEKEHEKTF